MLKKHHSGDYMFSIKTFIVALASAFVFNSAHAIAIYNNDQNHKDITFWVGYSKTTSNSKGACKNHHEHGYRIWWVPYGYTVRTDAVTEKTASKTICIGSQWGAASGYGDSAPVDNNDSCTVTFNKGGNDGFSYQNCTCAGGQTCPQ
jgi:hypothetical protein